MKLLLVMSPNSDDNPGIFIFSGCFQSQEQISFLLKLF